MSRQFYTGPQRSIHRTLYFMIFLLAISTGLAAGENFARLVDQAPVIQKAASLPRDDGHNVTADEIRNLAMKARGPLAPSPRMDGANVLFAHPMRKGIGNTRPGFYAISNYVDQDMAAPDMLLDYECGDRTYDLEDGSNHNGIDYFNFPFSWLSMQQDASIVVAAADGMIVDRNDGEPDMNCEFSDDAEPNYVILQHDDGTSSVYLHFKRGSTTPRAIGSMVEKGDYLGVVGSSGFSTGPHLHFGVYDPGGGLIEPHAGACNSLNDDSWWEDQEDYYVQGVSFLATHATQPVFPEECAALEQPNLENQFMAGDTVYLSVYFRDIRRGDVANIDITDEDGRSVVQFQPFEYQDEDPTVDHAAGYIVVYAVEFFAGTPAGAYTFSATFAGRKMAHTFYIDSGPNPPPSATVANNAYNGLWYDPLLDGEGYNFVTTNNGTVVYFYGSDRNGNRLWLISALIPGAFGEGGAIEVVMYESTGGTFAAPVPSGRGLSVWGTLRIQFTSCDTGVATLSGADGSKVSQIIKLAGVAGTACTAGDARPDSPWAGLWYDVSDEGEGYNFIVAPNGAVLYYYGFTSAGLRQWLISDLIPQVLEIGQPVEVVMYEATSGTFDSPTPSSMLSQWGTATITLVSCNEITIVLTGNDGNKTSATVRLAGVIGLDCSG